MPNSNASTARIITLGGPAVVQSGVQTGVLLWAALKSVIQGLPVFLAMMILSVIMLMSVHFHSQLMAEGENALVCMGQFYRTNLQPVLSFLAELLNPLTCWWDTFTYIYKRYLSSVLFQEVDNCGGLAPFIDPLEGIARSVFIDIGVHQVLNITGHLFSYPISIETLSPHIKDLGYLIRNYSCCACEDLCPLFNIVTAPLVTDDTYCTIQQLLNAAFFIWQWLSSTVWRFVLLLPPERPDLSPLVLNGCAAARCAVGAISSPIQTASDELFGIFDNTPVKDLLCPLNLITCAAFEAGSIGIMAIMNLDRIYLWPEDTAPPYAPPSQWLGNVWYPGVRRFANIIGTPLIVRDPLAAIPSIALGPPPCNAAYDYQPYLPIQFMYVNERLPPCLCRVIHFITPSVIPFDLCCITSFMDTIADALLAVVNGGLNYYQFLCWVNFWDFSWIEKILTPEGPLSCIPAIVSPISPDLEVIFRSVMLAAASVLHALLEGARVPLLQGDTFGFFMPTTLTLPSSRIRCIYNSNTVGCRFITSLTNAVDQLIIAVQAPCNLLSKILFGFSVSTICSVLAQFLRGIKSVIVLIWAIIEAILWGDVPDEEGEQFFAGPGEKLQNNIEEALTDLLSVTQLSCTALQFLFAILAPGQQDPCTCFALTANALAVAIVRLVTSVILNIARVPGFGSGHPQSGYFEVFGPYGTQPSNTYGPTNRRYLGRVDATGYPMGPFGDVEYVGDQVSRLVFCPVKLATIIPAFQEVIPGAEEAFSLWARTLIRLPGAVLMAIIQGRGDYFTNFRVGIVKDRFWRTTCAFMRDFILVFDRIQPPITNQMQVPTSLAAPIGGTDVPNEYPVNTGVNIGISPGQSVNQDFIDTPNPNGLTTVTITATIEAIVAVFLPFGIGGILFCPIFRLLRVLIGLGIQIAELILRLAVTVTFQASFKDDLLGWIFGCTVPLSAFQPGHPVFGSQPPSIVGTCADTEGWLSALIQAGNCPCLFLKYFTFGPASCLCNQIPDDPRKTPGVGLVTEGFIFIAEQARIILLILRSAPLFRFSVTMDVVQPLMIEVARVLIAATCLVVKLYPTTCSFTMWEKVVADFVDTLFSLVKVVSSILDQVMHTNVIKPQSQYGGGINPSAMSFTGANEWQLPSDPNCNPNLHPQIEQCTFRNQDDQTFRPNDMSGTFSFVSSVITSPVNLLVSFFEFLQCSIRGSTLKGPGIDQIRKVTLASITAIVELVHVFASVYYTVTWFVWQIIEFVLYLILYGLKLNIPAMIKAATRFFRLIVRALSGMPQDSMKYRLGAIPLNRLHAGGDVGTADEDTDAPTAAFKRGIHMFGTDAQAGMDDALRKMQMAALSGVPKSYWWGGWGLQSLILMSESSAEMEACKAGRLLPCLCPQLHQELGTEACTPKGNVVAIEDTSYFVDAMKRAPRFMAPHDIKRVAQNTRRYVAAKTLAGLFEGSTRCDHIVRHVPAMLGMYEDPVDKERWSGGIPDKPAYGYARSPTPLDNDQRMRMATTNDPWDYISPSEQAGYVTCLANRVRGELSRDALCNDLGPGEPCFFPVNYYYSETSLSDLHAGIAKHEYWMYTHPQFVVNSDAPGGGRDPWAHSFKAIDSALGRDGILGKRNVLLYVNNTDTNPNKAEATLDGPEPGKAYSYAQVTYMQSRYLGKLGNYGLEHLIPDLQEERAERNRALKDWIGGNGEEESEPAVTYSVPDDLAQSSGGLLDQTIRAIRAARQRRRMVSEDNGGEPLALLRKQVQAARARQVRIMTKLDPTWAGAPEIMGRPLPGDSGWKGLSGVEEPTVEDEKKREATEEELRMESINSMGLGFQVRRDHYTTDLILERLEDGWAPGDEDGHVGATQKGRKRTDAAEDITLGPKQKRLQKARAADRERRRLALGGTPGVKAGQTSSPVLSKETRTAAGGATRLYYDRETTDWLRGSGPMPEDLLDRPGGLELYERTVPIEPSLGYSYFHGPLQIGRKRVTAEQNPFPAAGRTWNDTSVMWASPGIAEGIEKLMDRAAAYRENDYLPDGKHVYDRDEVFTSGKRSPEEAQKYRANLRTRAIKAREDLESFAMSGLDTDTYEGYRRPADYRRPVYYIPGVNDPDILSARSGARSHPQRDTGDNILTWTARRDARLKKVADLMHKSKIVHPESHFSPRVQISLLRAAQATDYLMYGMVTGAFWAALEANEEGYTYKTGDPGRPTKRWGQEEFAASQSWTEYMLQGPRDFAAYFQGASSSWDNLQAQLKHRGSPTTSELPGAILGGIIGMGRSLLGLATGDSGDGSIPTIPPPSRYGWTGLNGERAASPPTSPPVSASGRSSSEATEGSTMGRIIFDWVAPTLIAAAPLSGLSPSVRSRQPKCFAARNTAPPTVDPAAPKVVPESWGDTLSRWFAGSQHASDLVTAGKLKHEDRNPDREGVHDVFWNHSPIVKWWYGTVRSNDTVYKLFQSHEMYQNIWGASSSSSSSGTAKPDIRTTSESSRARVEFTTIYRTIEPDSPVEIGIQKHRRRWTPQVLEARGNRYDALMRAVGRMWSASQTPEKRAQSEAATHQAIRDHWTPIMATRVATGLTEHETGLRVTKLVNEKVHERHQRFILGGNCHLADLLISDFVRIITYCANFPVPLPPPPGKRRYDDLYAYPSAPSGGGATEWGRVRDAEAVASVLAPHKHWLPHVAPAVKGVAEQAVRMGGAGGAGAGPLTASLQIREAAWIQSHQMWGEDPMFDVGGPWMHGWIRTANVTGEESEHFIEEHAQASLDSETNRDWENDWAPIAPGDPEHGLPVHLRQGNPYVPRRWTRAELAARDASRTKYGKGRPPIDWLAPVQWILRVFNPPDDMAKLREERRLAAATAMRNTAYARHGGSEAWHQWHARRVSQEDRDAAQAGETGGGLSLSRYFRNTLFADGVIVRSAFHNLSAASLIARFLDWFSGHVIHRALDLTGTLSNLLSGSGDFLTNTNTDEDLGPLGFRGWLKVLYSCRFPESLNCAHGVGAKQAVYDLFIWAVIFILVISYMTVPAFGATLVLAGIFVSFFIFTVHAWRWTPMCAFSMFPPMFPTPFTQIPMCIWNDIIDLLNSLLRNCYDEFPSWLRLNTDVCRPCGQRNTYLNCATVGVTDGYGVLLGLLDRWTGPKACVMAATFISSFGAFGPLGLGQVIPTTLRDYCNVFSTATPTRRTQQNFCMVLMSPALVADMYLLSIVLGALFILLAILWAWVRAAGIITLVIVSQDGSGDGASRDEAYAKANMEGFQVFRESDKNGIRPWARE